MFYQSTYSLLLLKPFPMMFDFIRAIILLTFSLMYIASKGSMFPFPTILVLKNTRIYIDPSNSSDVLFYTIVSVNQTLCFGIIL